MAQADDSEVCQQYLLDYIEDIKKQIDKYEIKLTNQSVLCPITSISFDVIDHCLKEYVDCQRKYLSTRNNKQLIKFKDNIKKNELFESVTTYYPTMDQNEYINRLITIRQKQTEIRKELLQLEMRILYKFLPQNFDHLQKFITSITYAPVNNELKIIQLNNVRYKLIQEAKRQWLNISLSVYDIKLLEYEQQYEEILIQLQSILIKSTSVHDSSLFNNITQYVSYRTAQLTQDIRVHMTSFQRKLLQHRQRSSSTKDTMNVSPEPYLDLLYNPFNKLEWHHLSLDIYTKVRKNLVEYHHIPRTQPIFQEYSNQLLNYLHHCYFAPLPYIDHMQAKEQAQIVASIRNKIKQHNLIIRLTDKSNNFYIGSTSEFEKKAQKYFIDTNAYMELSDNPFDEVLNKVIQLLNNLRSKKLILKWHYEEMMPDPKKAELSYLYFNPKTHKDNIPVRPIMNTIRASTTNISKLLDKIIRPIFDDKCGTTTIIDGAYLIQVLQQYVEKGLFKRSTLFCTFDIHNLYTMLPQDASLNILIEFLHLHGYKKVKGIALDTIRKLASIVLKENVFVYDNKFYKQTTGGAMGSSFTLTLANIFMWKWQKEFVRRQDITNEFYGRYIDDIFLTWNKSEQELKDLLNEANHWHSNIKLDYNISQSLPFLDILLTNNNGILSTSVYHKPSAEPYVVPFISDHPRHVFGNIIQTALTRAVRYSSTFQTFNYERCYIKLMLLYNGYPSSLIENQFKKFFIQYTNILSFLPFIVNDKQFFLMRDKITSQPTSRQSQVVMNASTAHINNDQTDATTDNEYTEYGKKAEEKTKQYGDELFIHYKHEKRFE